MSFAQRSRKPRFLSVALFGAALLPLAVLATAGPAAAARPATVVGPTVTRVSPASGTAAGGTKVMITGTGFTGASTVDFGAVAAASFTVSRTGTSITAYSPAEAAGLVDLTVTVGSTTSAIVTADQFTFLDTSVTMVRPDTGSVAGGLPVSISGKFFTGATEVLFGSVAVPAADFTVNATGSVITLDTPAHAAGLVDVTVVAPAGTSPAVTHDQFTYGVPWLMRATPHSGPSTGGTIVTITGYYMTIGVEGVTFGGVAAESFAVGAHTITAVAPPGTAGSVVAVQVETTAGTTAVSSMGMFTYEPPPPVS